MAKSGGGTRSGSSSNPRGVSGTQLTSRYERGGSVANWLEQSNKRDAMMSTMRDFASSHDMTEGLYEITHALNPEDNVRSFSISVESNPTFNQAGDVVRYDVVYRTQPTSYRYVGPTANKAYWRLLDDADRTFTDIEKAYKHISDITKKINKIKLL